MMHKPAWLSASMHRKPSNDFQERDSILLVYSCKSGDCPCTFLWKLLTAPNDRNYHPCIPGFCCWLHRLQCWAGNLPAWGITNDTRPAWQKVHCLIIQCEASPRRGWHSNIARDYSPWWLSEHASHEAMAKVLIHIQENFAHLSSRRTATAGLLFLCFANQSACTTLLWALVLV